jgi:hypothetical protein
MSTDPATVTLYSSPEGGSTKTDTATGHVLGPPDGFCAFDLRCPLVRDLRRLQ